MTHDYKRNGTTTLFAGQNVLTGNRRGHPGEGPARASQPSRK